MRYYLITLIIIIISQGIIQENNPISMEQINRLFEQILKFHKEKQEENAIKLIPRNTTFTKQHLDV